MAREKILVVTMLSVKTFSSRPLHYVVVDKLPNHYAHRSRCKSGEIRRWSLMEFGSGVISRWNFTSSGSIIRFIPQLETTAARGQQMAAFASRAGFVQRKLALLLASTLILPALAHAQKPPMVDVGVVLPQDVITGETVSGSVIVNPSDYANIPGLHVVTGQVPGVAGSTPANLLSNYSLQIGSTGTTLP